MGNKFIPLGVILSVLVLLFVTKPRLQEIKSLNAQLKARNEDITNISGTKKQLEEMKVKLNAASDQIQRLQLAMPAAQQLPEVLVMVEEISKKSKFKISNFSVSPVSSGNEIGVTMNGYGTYASLYDFTDTLEQNIRPIKIKSLNLSRGGDRGNVINASVSLGVVYQGTYKQQVAPQE